MTEANHCYENAPFDSAQGVAEQMGGILKQWYALDDPFGRNAGVPVAVAEGVSL